MYKLQKFSFAFLMIAVIASCTSNNTPPSSAVQKITEEPPVNTDIKSDSKGTGKFTLVDVGTLNKDLAAKGELVFQRKCISCHTNTQEKLIGPGLKGITRLRTPEWIMNMTFNPEEMAKKDPLAKALRKQYKLPMMVPGGTTEEECREVLEYLRLNDEK